MELKKETFTNNKKNVVFKGCIYNGKYASIVEFKGYLVSHIETNLQKKFVSNTKAPLI